MFEGGEGKDIFSDLKKCIKYIKEKRKRGVFEGGEGKEITIIKNNLGVHQTEKEEGI